MPEIRCKECSFWKQSISQMQFGNFTEGIGNKDADIMVIFDSIFESDIHKDKLFSHDIYRDMLEEFLASANVELKDVYISTLVKCFISDRKKKPTKTCKDKCFSAHLEKEIAEVKPKIIILCGTTASKFFIPETVNMKQLVGNIFYSNVYNAHLIPVYDPYYLSNFSHQTSQKKKTYEAFGKINTVLNKEDKISEKTKYSSDVADLSKLEDLVTIDLETTGLNFLEDEILTIGISDRKRNLAFDYGDEGGIPWDKIIPEMKKRKLNFHNAIFDLLFHKHAKHNLERRLVGDTRLLQFLINPLGATSLGFLSQLVFGFSYKDEVDRTSLKEQTPEYRKEYCATDTAITHKLFYKLFPKVKAQGSLISYKVFINFIKVLCNLQYKGIKASRKMINDIVVHYQKLKDEAEANFKKRLRLDDEFNMNSPKQMQNILFGEDSKLKLTPVIKTKSGTPSCGAEAIELLKGKKPVLEKLIEYRTYKGHIEKALMYQKAIRVDGRVHSDFNMFSPDSSRVMSRKPNIQNVPRDSRLKEIFVPEEGYSYVYYDYSQIEFRVWVHLAKDPVGTKFINEGKDIHTYIASRFWKVTEEEVSKKQRDIIKSVVYGSLYGRTPESIAQEHQISVDEAKQIQRTFFNICKKGYFWLKQTGQEAEKNKKVKTPFGTFKLLPDLDMSLGYKKEEMIRSAINFVVQSWAVELVYIGAYKVWKEIQKQGLDACYVHQIHDAGILEVRDSQVKQVIEIIKQFANNPVKLSIPIVAEIKTGKSWATLQTVE